MRLVSNSGNVFLSLRMISCEDLRVILMSKGAKMDRAEVRRCFDELSRQPELASAVAVARSCVL
jgi:hypothetical protein